MKKHPRRIAREVVMQHLYASFISNSLPEKELEDCISAYKGDENNHAYIEKLFMSVLENTNEVDSDIEKHLQNWEFSRIALIDKILLRMGVVEITLFSDMPPKVTISEMVEIAKIYSSEESSSFVNGILDSVYKDFLNRGEAK